MRDANKNLAIANRSRVSCTHNTSMASIVYTSLFAQKEQQARKQTIKATTYKH